jgi:hypothetical protein
MIREKDNFFQLGVINTTSTYNKALVSHHKNKYKNPKKKYSHHNNNKTRVPNPLSQLLIPMGTRKKNTKVRILALQLLWVRWSCGV